MRILAVVLLALVAGGCVEDSSDSGSEEVADTSLAAAEFEATFGEPPEACEAGYGVWETGLAGDDHDVTYCYSGEMFGNPPHPSNTGCYITETGEGITVAFRNINGTGTC